MILKNQITMIEFVPLDPKKVAPGSVGTMLVPRSFASCLHKLNESTDITYENIKIICAGSSCTSTTEQVDDIQFQIAALLDVHNWPSKIIVFASEDAIAQLKRAYPAEEIIRVFKPSKSMSVRKYDLYTENGKLKASLLSTSGHYFC